MRFFTSVHILLLAYIISALVFWGISLHKKSVELYDKDVLMLRSQVDSTQQPALYNKSILRYKDDLKRHNEQYIGEGSTFLVIILIGAAVVYTSFQRRIRLSRQQNNFMLSVTHELKSPIAAMKLNLQTLERHKLDEEKKMQLVERCISEANRLNDLCNNMLIASQMEGRQYVPAKESLDFAALVESSVKDYASRYHDRFSFDDEYRGKNLVGDRLLLQMALNNLLENAIKYTPPGSPIEVTLKTNDNCAVLKVSDQGTGIPDSEKDKVFNKFYRVGNEETRKTKGTGLGLYLTSKIVKQHNGKIAVMDNVPSGTVFEILLPFNS